MRIAITGSTGFVGGAMVRFFAERGYDIIALGRQKNPPDRLNKYAKYINCDLKETIPAIDSEIVIHSAGLASDTAAYEELYQHNVITTRILMEAARNAKRIIFISSSSVYAPNKNAIAESYIDQNTDALTSYGHTKLLAEKEVERLSQKHQTNVILRPRAVYGVGDRSLLPRILEMVRFGRLIKPGSMNINTSLTHIDNLSLAVERCIHEKLEPGNIKCYNVTDNCTYMLSEAIKELVNKIYEKEVAEFQIPIGIVKSIGRLSSYMNKNSKISPLMLKALSQDNVLDISSIKKELNFIPPHQFNTKVDEIAAWVKNVGGAKLLLKNRNHIPWMY